ncbi:MAG TPA: 1-acyl-sn-glycerol-3-phosphate acyltransferase [Acidimicrobiales bacterium]|nr:1-acyl-sn-glycerol-3-phosphate acyltransferase [Acidimicrobiales bacterium]
MVSTIAASKRVVVMTDDSDTLNDERLVLRDIRALLDQLQLDRDGSLTMQSKLTDELGVDSLALVELCDQLERTFDVSLPDEVFLTATTPQHWLDAVNVARGVESSKSDDANSPEAPGHVDQTLNDRTIAVAKRLVAVVRDRRNAHGGATSTKSWPSVGSMGYTLYAWVLLIPFAVTIWALAVLPITLAQRRSIGRAVARSLCRALGISVSVDGVLPDSDQPSVITANHSSFIDGLVLYVFLDQPVTFVASTDMERQFLLGRIMRGFGCVFVNRGRAERSAESVEILVRTIRSGHHVLIFPEGSISAQPGLRVFRLGAFEAATSSKCPVVPVGIRGSRRVLRPGSYLSHPGKVRVMIGDLIVPAGSEFTDRVALRDQTRESIAHLCGEIGT